MRKHVLGLDLGSNSIGWALIAAGEDETPTGLVDSGVRIFPRATEDKTPTPKNAKRRERRLARRVVQRRARRKRRMMNYLIPRSLLPAAMATDPKPEAILNRLGNPYHLRAKALDEALWPSELGRVFYHLVQRRGFLSNKKILAGDMADDPDVLALLEEDEKGSTDAEETAFKADIANLRQLMADSKARTLGEYLAKYWEGDCKRNRIREGGRLRTDRAMYMDEFEQIISTQSAFHPRLGEMAEALEEIIFFQRPLRLKSDRVGRCSLEPKKTRCQAARLEYQRFRYLQDINHLKYMETKVDKEKPLSLEQKQKLVPLFESAESLSLKKLRKALGLDEYCELNLERGVKKLKGNLTACKIRKVLPTWDERSADEQAQLVEDLLSMTKKSALKRRLVKHWGLDAETAVKLCLLEFEPGHGNVSLKAIGKLLPHLEEGLIYSDARVEAGYAYEKPELQPKELLGAPPDIPNPIVSRALHELRRVINALIKEYGKPDIIRIEMARDLEANTKRYDNYERQQKKNTKANDEAAEKFKEVRRAQGGTLSLYPSRADKLKYRLWQDQDYRCAYSGATIGQAMLFSDAVEVDHIVPYSQSLNDSYMNKVVCLAGENRVKSNRTPYEAFSGDSKKWNHITQQIARWPWNLKSKRDRFFLREHEVLERDFLGSQLTDTRYIGTETSKYLQSLGVDITFTRGSMTAWLRRLWSLNGILGNTGQKQRDDHRHHALDAVVTACTSRSVYRKILSLVRDMEKSRSALSLDEITLEPPWAGFSDHIIKRFDSMIISHTPGNKISGPLHKDTGLGFIEGLGTVGRLNINGAATKNKLENVIDPVVRARLLSHLEANEGNARMAFVTNGPVYLKDGKTPIKRARVITAKINDRTTLESTKLGIKDKQGEVFRWMTYGSFFEVVVFKSANGKKFKGHFVTMHEAAQKQGFIEHYSGDNSHLANWEYCFRLRGNQSVSVVDQGERRIYRLQKFERSGGKLTSIAATPPNLSLQKFEVSGGTLVLRLHSAATLEKKDEEIRKSLTTLMKQYQMRPVRVNAIGAVVDD